MTFAPINSKTAFLSTAETYPKDEEQRLIKHTSLHTDVANAVNVREIALYQDRQEVLTGQQFSIPGDNRKKDYTYRKVIYFGAIATNITRTIPHGITNIAQFTRMYGTCIATSGGVTIYKPIPWVSWLNVQAQIQLYADDKFVYIGNGPIADPIVSGLLVLEYEKS